MANITRKDPAWEWIQSWYILLTLALGLSSFAAFLYVWFRGRKLSWLLSAVFYLIAIWGALILMVPDAEQANSTTATGGNPLSMVLGFVYFGCWMLSIIHAIMIRKTFLLTLEAREEIAVKETDRLRTEIRAASKVLDNRVDESLIKFKEDDITVKLCRNLFSALPFAPDFRYYFNIEGATERLVFDKAEAQAVSARALEIARQDDGIAAA
ncbi:MAG: hypothetical protein KDK39_10345, partial [Leptospiraceae bacterium]|nr:hypothetical protein [Leptospiraceae bacterium]